MELSKKDRLILINQYRILAALNKEDAAHYTELADILENGYAVFYSSIEEWVSDDMPVEEGRFVLRVLDFYRAIEDKKIAAKSGALSEHRYSYFRGFDGNNETQEFAFCRFLVNKQGKFQEQKKYLLRNDNMNSHMEMIPKYQRMLDAAKGKDIGSISVEEAIAILDA